MRNAQKLAITHPNLQLIQGDATNAADVEKTIAGAEAVISVLGPAKGAPADVLTQATRHILSSMSRHNIRRLVSLTGGGVRDAQHDKPKFIDNAIVFIMKNLAGKGTCLALEDGIRHAQLIKDSKTEWTIVRGPVLTDEPAKGQIQVGHVGTVKGIRITREDLADFILKELEEEKYLRQMPFLTNG